MSATAISLYDSTGLILCSKVAEDPVFCTTSRSGAAGHVEGHHNAATKYVASGSVADRPSNPTTISGLVLSNVPNPATVVIDGVEYPTTDTTVTLDLPQSGTYKVTVKAFPMLDKDFTVVVP